MSHLLAPVLIAPPTDDVVTLDEVKEHLRIDVDDDNDSITGFRDAVVNMLDPAGGGWLGRALREQTWEYRLPGFQHIHRDRVAGFSRRHPQAIEIPYPPLIEIVSIKYDDQAGTEQELVEDTNFRVIDGGVLNKSAVAPLYNQFWPIARPDIESVRIRFTAGYPVAAAAHDNVPAVVDRLPGAIKSWIKLVIGSLYENRESASVTAFRSAVIELPDHIMQMMSTYRVY